jgi:predicted amidohydrolase
MVRVGGAQLKNRVLDFHMSPSEALAEIEASLSEIEQVVHKAGKAGCDALALPEDTLGLVRWEAGNKADRPALLWKAVPRMLEQLGTAATSHSMYLVCGSDVAEEDGAIYNASFLLGRDGKVIGRYNKVQNPLHDLDKQRGEDFPVFPTPDLGGVGLSICYDMVFPETPRCLMLNGADILFHSTMAGGAAMGKGDLSRAAYRVRAVENFVYIVIAERSHGALVISPQGEILAEGEGPDGIAIADIDPFGAREGGDAMNSQADMRARFCRERTPTAYRILTDPNPPVLKKVLLPVPVEEIVRIAAATLTVGEERFSEADALLRAGKRDEARQAFERLHAEFPHSWIDRLACERLAQF